MLIQGVDGKDVLPWLMDKKRAFNNSGVTITPAGKNHKRSKIVRNTDGSILSDSGFTRRMKQIIGSYPHKEIFEITDNRLVGEIIGCGIVRAASPELAYANHVKTGLNECDMLLMRIVQTIQNSYPKAEVKLCRITDDPTTKKSRLNPMTDRAAFLSTGRSFKCNFAHMKDSCCHVFILIAVFADCILTWVINSRDAISKTSPQTRKSGETDRQLTISSSNLHEFARFETALEDIPDAIERQTNELGQSKMTGTVPAQPPDIFGDPFYDENGAISLMGHLKVEDAHEKCPKIIRHIKRCKWHGAPTISQIIPHLNSEGCQIQDTPDIPELTEDPFNQEHRTTLQTTNDSPQAGSDRLHAEQ